jgi:hypothetical protein
MGPTDTALWASKVDYADSRIVSLRGDFSPSGILPVATGLRVTRLISRGIHTASAHRTRTFPLASLFAGFLVLMVCSTAAGAVITLNYGSYCENPDSGCCDLGLAIQSHNDQEKHGGCAAGTGDDTIVCPFFGYIGRDEPAVSSGYLTITHAEGISSSKFYGTYLTVNSGATLELKDISLTVTEQHFTIDKSLITNNGGIVILRASDLTNNGIRPPASGGAIANHGGEIFIEEPYNKKIVRLNGNAARQGGAIYNDAGTVTFKQSSGAVCEQNSALDGGCIFTRNGEVSIGSSHPPVRLDHNGGQKGGRGGAIAAENSKISINGAQIEENTEPDNAGLAGLGGAIYIDPKSTLILANGSCNGNTSRLGGCLYSNGGSVRLDNVLCSGNSTIDGGCLFTGPTGGGKLNISNSKISNNKATSGSRGGGLLLENTEALIGNSEITGNSAGTYGDGGIGSGGGIFGLTSNSNSPTEITMVGSTLADNTASKLGAGMELENFSSVTAVNSTFANEGPADLPEHGLHFDNSYANFDFTTLSLAPLSVEGVVEGDLRNSIFSDSSLCLGNVADGGGNLQYPEPFRSCQTSIPVANPLLDPAGLKDNGGPTPTIALLPDSAAIDAVSLNDCTDQNKKPIVIDQRGKPRPAPRHDACDSGAYEYQGMGSD